MNFSEEQNRPLYVVRTARSYKLSAEQRYEALANKHAIEDAGNGQQFIKAAAINSMPELLKEAMSATDATAEKKLIVARLKAVPDKQYRFMDGTVYTGIEAAREVEKGTDRGNYFMRLEEKVLKIAREAQQRGEF